MERHLNRFGTSRVALLALAALVLTVAAMASGYGVRALTSSSSGHAQVVSTRAATSAGTPAQSDVPCLWIGTRKAC